MVTDTNFRSGPSYFFAGCDAEIQVWHHFSEPTVSGQADLLTASLSQRILGMLIVLSNLGLAIALQFRLA
jgi:hypothetical protein